MKQLLASCVGLLIASATPQPVEVLQVFPPDQSTQTYVKTFGVALSPQEGEGVAPSSIQLLIDGVDVTSLAEFNGTRDGCIFLPKCHQPPSLVTLGYTPNSLPPGTHQAEIRFRTRDGRPKSYHWSFTVQSPY